MDTCGYIQEICDGDFRSTATEEQRVIFFEPVSNLIEDYETHYSIIAGRDKFFTRQEDKPCLDI